MTTVSSLVEINQQQAEQIKQLNAERDAFESDVDTFAQHNIELQQENARLRAALEDLLEFAIDSTCGKQHAVAEAHEALKGQQ